MQDFSEPLLMFILSLHETENQTMQYFPSLSELGNLYSQNILPDEFATEPTPGNAEVNEISREVFLHQEKAFVG